MWLLIYIYILFCFIVFMIALIFFFLPYRFSNWFWVSTKGVWCHYLIWNVYWCGRVWKRRENYIAIHLSIHLSIHQLYPISWWQLKVDINRIEMIMIMIMIMIMMIIPFTSSSHPSSSIQTDSSNFSLII